MFLRKVLQIQGQIDFDTGVVTDRTVQNATFLHLRRARVASPLAFWWLLLGERLLHHPLNNTPRFTYRAFTPSSRTATPLVTHVSRNKLGISRASNILRHCIRVSRKSRNPCSRLPGALEGNIGPWQSLERSGSLANHLLDTSSDPG